MSKPAQPRLLRSIDELRAWRETLASPASVGFIPTMGALHAGHTALMERARETDAHRIASIFVNPTQFNDPQDCATYPQPLEADLAQCAAAGVEAVFLPTRAMLYPDDYRYRVSESDFATLWEGVQRPGHFDGVLTIVLKLFQLVRPTRAYFGEKDWQQLQLVRGMVEAFFLPLEVVACPTIRESDGLAMASRNVRLSPQGRQRARAFPEALRDSATAEAAERRLANAGFAVEYVVDADSRRLAAVTLDGVRLIDNWPLSATAAAPGAPKP